MNYLYNKINDTKKIILVDCFDTLLYRVCAPNAVLKRWFEYISENYSVSSDDVADMWKLSTQRFDEHCEELRFKDVAFNMYTRMNYYKSAYVEFDEFYNDISDAYVDIEESVLQVNDELWEFLYKEKINGKNIYLVSDFYMSYAFFEKVFERLNILSLFDGMFVSSELGLRKSTGSIYPFVLNDIGVSASDVVMIGDNRISDYERPKKIGIHAIQYKCKHASGEFELNAALINIFENQLKNCPLSNYAYTIYLFMHNLLMYVEEEKVGDIYFCSREGEFFKHLFDSFIIKKGKKGIVNTHYILVSRQATFLPSLNSDILKETFATLSRSSKNISIAEFMGILGLNSEDIGIKTDLNRSIPDFFNSDELSNLKADAKFSEAYTSRVLSQKNEFRKYLASLGITDDSDSITLVDVGWRGTIQDNIYNYFNGKVNINGLYYGLERTQIENLNNKKFGLVYHDIPVKNRYFDIFTTSHRMLERVLQASHGSALTYKDGTCILSELDSKELSLFEIMKETKKKIEDVVFDIDNLFSKYQIGREKVTEVVAMLHEMYLCSYTNKMYRLEKSVSGLMSMTFGSSANSRSYKEMLKSFVKTSRVERFNKCLKLFRRLHCGILCDLLCYSVYARKKKRFLKMEI